MNFKEVYDDMVFEERGVCEMKLGLFRECKRIKFELLWLIYFIFYENR